MAVTRNAISIREYGTWKEAVDGSLPRFKRPLGPPQRRTLPQSRPKKYRDPDESDYKDGEEDDSGSISEVSNGSSNGRTASTGAFLSREVSILTIHASQGSQSAAIGVNNHVDHDTPPRPKRKYIGPVTRSKGKEKMRAMSPIFEDDDAGNWIHHITVGTSFNVKQTYLLES